MKDNIKKHRIFFWILYIPVYFIFFTWLEKRNDVAFHIIHTGLDDKIPFCKYFIIPYVIWFFYVFLSVAYFILYERQEFNRLAWFLALGMTTFLIVSWLYPNKLMLRPDTVTGNDICARLVRRLYASDTSTNVMPSIHVYNSIVVAVAFLKSKANKKHHIVGICSVILSALIIISTMFVKQHSVVDVVTAMDMAVVYYLIIYVLPQFVCDKSIRQLKSDYK